MRTNTLFAYLLGLGFLCLNFSSQAQNTLSGPLTINGATLLNGDAKVFGGKLGIDPTSNGFTIMEAIHLRDGNFRIDNGQIMAFDELTFHPDIDNNGDDEVRFLNSTGEINLFIGREGRVGIGLSNPTEKLTISGNLEFNNGSGDFFQGNIRNVDQIIGADDIRLSGDGVGGDDVMINGDGNVGIGLSNPTEKLTISGNLEFNNGSGDFFQGNIRNVDQIIGADDIRLSGDGVGGDDVMINGDGNVGIGTFAPQEKLDVDGNVKANAFIGDGSQLTGIDATDNWDLIDDNLVNENAGNVGIGTSRPESKLEVLGDAKVSSGKLGIDPANINFAVEEALHLRDGNFRIDNGQIMAFDELTFHPDIDNSGDDVVQFLDSDGDTNLLIDENGRVGIGQASNLLFSLNIADDNPFGTNMSLRNTTAGGKTWTMFSTGAANSEGAGNLLFRDESAGVRMMLGSDGNVGIGTTTANEKLTVRGKVKAEFFQTTNNINKWTEIGHGGSNGFINVSGNSGSGNLDFRHDNVTQMSLTEAGNLGIGTTAPTEKMEVVGNIKATGDLQLTNAATQVGLTTEGGGIILNMDYNFRHDNVDTDRIGAAFRVDSRINDPLFQWLRRSAGSTGGGTEIMTLNREGQLGIGTRNATATLDVVGNARIRNLPSGSGRVVVVDANGNLFRSATLDASHQQAEMITELREENEELRSRLEQLEQLVNSIVQPSTISVQSATLSNAELKQNSPNPFSNTTSISYFIPEHINEAVLKIMDANGNLLKTIDITEKGQGQVDLQAYTLSAGTYTYSLILDGHLSDTKQMILTN